VPLTISRSVTVKAVVTEGLKQRLGLELRAALARLDAELARLEAAEREQAAESGGADSSGEGLPSAERRRAVEQREQLLARLKELARLKLGTEIVEGTVESQVEVRPGDDWQRLMAAEIVLEDGRVVAVRE
jgi:hypothetical protein